MALTGFSLPALAQDPPGTGPDNSGVSPSTSPQDAPAAPADVGDDNQGRTRADRNGCPCPKESDDLTIEDLPDNVRATVERETQGAMIEEIEQKRGPNGRRYYKVEYRRQDGQEWKLAIGPDGQVISRRRD